MQASPVGLTISELSRRTGVPQATLRTWEARYGSPRPRRLAGGHRRYVDQDVALVERVLRARASGLSLEAAFAGASAASAEREPSVFAGLRRRHPRLVSRTLSKRALLALTRAIEDECCAQASSPMLFASFQQARFFEQSRARYADFARTAEQVVVFADFAEASRRRSGPTNRATGHGAVTRVSVPANVPLVREWVLVCEAEDYPACVAGWELPGQDEATDVQRRFEVCWTLDPRAVRHAALICAGLAETFGHAHDPALHERLSAVAPAPSLDLQRTIGLFTRVVGYVDEASWSVADRRG